MEHELEYAANRIRHAMKISNRSQDLLLVVGRYIQETLNSGYFSGIRFAEFRGDVIDPERGRILSYRTVMGLHNLATNAKEIGVPYPESLPELIKGRVMPFSWSTATILSHMEAFASLLEWMAANSLDAQTNNAADNSERIGHPVAPAIGNGIGEAGVQEQMIPKGISLLDVAMFLSEHDPVAANATKKRWQNNRDPALPGPIGIDKKHSQTNLYDLDELLTFVGELEGETQVNSCRGKLKKILRPIRVNRPKPSEPSAKFQARESIKSRKN